MEIKKIIESIAKEVNLPYEVVELAYMSYWKFIRSTIVKLPLKEPLTLEEFSKLRTNFNIPSLGKLTCTPKRFLGIKLRYKLLKEIYKNNKDGRQ